MVSSVSLEWTVKQTHLCSEDELIADTARLGPLSDELFGATTLAIHRDVIVSIRNISIYGCYQLVIRSVDEISTRGKVCIKETEGRLLVHRSHSMCSPLVADTHASKAEWRDIGGSARSNGAVIAKTSGRLGSRREERHRW